MTHEPFYCRLPQNFSSEVRWLADYEEFEYDRTKSKAEYHNGKHTLFRGVPHSVSSIDSSRGTDINGTEFGGEGYNIDASVLGVLFPQGSLPVVPIACDVTKGYDEHPGMMGPVMDYFDTLEADSIDFDAATASAFFVAQRRLTRFHDISIVNFLLELKDLKKMLLDCRHAVASYKDLMPELLGPRPTKRAIARVTADKYLSFKFGWCPFVRDIITIAKTLANMRKRIKTLLEKIHEINVCRVKLTQFEVPAFEDDHVYEQFDIPHCDGVINYEYPPSVATFTKPTLTTPKATIKWSLYCEDLSRINLELRSYLEAFGLRWDPAIIWNAIPFSFCVDWIWDVSSWLEQLAKPTLPVKLRIFEMCLSHEFQGDLYVQVQHNQTTPGPPMGYSTYTKKYHFLAKRFRRWLTSPTLEHLRRANWDKNVIDKTLLGASLITTQVAKEKARLFKPRFDPASRTLKEFRILRKKGYLTLVTPGAK